MDLESQDAGSAPDQSVGDTDQGSNQKKQDYVKYESFDKLVGQLKKTKELNDQLSRRVADFEMEKKQIEEAKLAEQGEYKKLLEMRTTEINELQQKIHEERSGRESANRTLIDAQKLQAVYEELPGRIENPKYMQWVDIESVAYNPETGEVDRESAKLVANKFMDEHPKLVDTSHVGRLPGNSASHSRPISQTFRDLPLDQMRSRISEAVRQAKQERGV